MPLVDPISPSDKFLLVIQLTMIDFCGMHFTEIDHFHNVNPEVPSWVESVIPMFKYSASVTGMVDFKW
jgi:hypothetical protein